MFNYLINSIVRYVLFNIADVCKGDVDDSFFSIGVVYGFTEVIRKMGHKVEFEWDDCYDDFCRVLYLVIDGIVLVEENKINTCGCEKLLEK